MDSNLENMRQIIRILVREELKEMAKDPKFKKVILEMLNVNVNESGTSSNECEEEDLPKNHEGCRATQDLVEKLQKEINNLKTSVAAYEKENQEYKNLVCTYMTTCLGSIEDLDSILKDLCGKRYFEKKVLKVLKSLTKKKVKRLQAQGNKEHKSSHAKNEHVNQEQGDAKNVSAPSNSKPEESKQKMHRKLLETYTLGKDDIIKQRTMPSRPYRGNAMYSCATGTGYDILRSVVKSHTRHHNQQKALLKDELKIRERIQHLTNLILLKKSEHSMILNRAGPQLPYFTKPQARERTLNKRKAKCSEISDKNANLIGENDEGKNPK